MFIHVVEVLTVTFNLRCPQRVTYGNIPTDRAYNINNVKPLYWTYNQISKCKINHRQ